MKTWIHIVCLYLFVGATYSSSAQVDPEAYGDEWISENQDYYKFNIDKSGIYRITAETLRAEGIPINDLAGYQFSIFSFGKQIPLRTSTSGNFKNDDYIEFYGTSNDGTIDALLYENPSIQQLNPYISLYSNDRPYYLTWSNEGSDNRYTELSNGLGAIGLPPKEPYYMHREIITYDEFHHKPSHDGRNFIRYSSMDDGEGYGTKLEEARTIELNVAKLSPFGVDPKIVARFGTNTNSKNWIITSDYRTLKISPQKGYGIVDIDERFTLDDLQDGNFNVHIAPVSGADQKHTLARIELHYPRKYEYDGEVEINFHQQASILSRYVEINGYGGTDPILYNLTEDTYMIPGYEDGVIKFVTGAAFQENNWILVDRENAVQSITDLNQIHFQPSPQNSEYLIISHSDLISSGAIEEYANYRSSEVGGAYETSILDIDDLIERYGYGIKGHPIAIKNMMRFLKDEEALPDYTFIIGKGREYTEIKEGKTTKALVPTFGIPGSDNLFLSFGDKRHPVEPIGRLAAQSSQEVLDYLSKIKTHEIRSNESQTIEDQSWKKGVVHLSGGSANNQAVLFRFLNDMGNVISGNSFGANVSTFRKTTADPLQRVTTEEIMNRIDQGAALITFFGHSAVGTFDFSLEDPQKYSNQGRNPIILSLGCHSGNIHTAAGGISEDFVLEKDNGAIAFIASSGTAYPEPQYFTGINFYDLFGGQMYGQPVGDILQRSLEERTDNPSVSVQTLIEQLTLHGDPAYRHTSFNGPDYSIDQSSVTIEPSILNATTASFTLGFDVINLGASIHEALDIEVIHLLPNGSAIDTQLITIPAPGHNSRVNIDLNNPGTPWVGSNRIKISVDPAAQIAESPREAAESNNELVDQNGKKGIAFFVFDNSAKPITPSNYGILNAEKIVLRSAVNNGLSPGGVFLLQIDTTDSFNSPLFTEEIIENTSSIIDWIPTIPNINNLVYYWRIAPIDISDRTKALSWQQASFIFLPDGPNGWNQSHFDQIEDNSFYKMSLESSTRRFEFIDREWDIRIKNEIRDDGDFWVYVNSTPWASLNPRNHGSLISIFAWDRQEVIIKNSGSDFGSIPFTSDGFLYDMQDPEDIENIITLLNAIPDGARIFFHTMIDDENASLNISSWDLTTSYGLSLIEYLEEQGANRISEILEKGTVPYTFIYDKGQGPVIEDIANNIYETVDLTSKAKTQWSEGTVTSVQLTAQDRWLRLMWEEEKEESDNTRLIVLGIKAGGQRDTLKNVSNDYDINLTSIDPAKYTRLELIYQTEDKVFKTAPQLKYWRVITNSLPDAAFYATPSSFAISDTLNAGEDLHLDFDLVNLTNIDMEPVLIKYTYIDQNYKETVITRRSKWLRALDTINVVEDIPTDRLSGAYQVVIEVNPNEDQKELTTCNNLGFTNFFVVPDRRNPFLDVTFDGRYISDKEEVVATPEILISLRDEDSALLLDNPNDFDISIFSPQNEKWRFTDKSENVTWIPSTSLEENRASFVLHPKFIEEGVYILEVQAKDIAGNKAGNLAYRISFVVDFSLDVPKLVVRPNPMITSTEFVYYLDSDFIPEIFDLYIYSADGKRIKHASKADFGGLQRGLNTYRWDGLSESGKGLPMGLYYYEIVNSFDSRKEKRKGSILKIGN